MENHQEQQQKKATKNEPKYRGIKAMPFVIGNETFEKLGTIGTSSNLLVYLTTVFHMKTISATNLINIFNGTCNFGTLIGGFLSDTYFGRYKTLGFASVSSFLGMLMLTLTAAVEKLHPPSCRIKEEEEDRSKCIGPTGWQMGFLLSGFVFLIIGASGIRPCNLAFGADQFNPNSDSGKRGINSFFNWYYFTYTFAMMVSLTIIVYVQSNLNWSIGLAIPTFLMFLSCVTFFVGTRIYVRILPEGSPFTSVAQVVLCAIKKRKLDLPHQPRHSLYTTSSSSSSSSINSRISYTDQFRFLSKAAIITPEDEFNPDDGSAKDPWKLCSIQQVEEVKCLIKVIPIWVSGIMYYVSVVQQQNYVVFQALQSDRSLGIGHFKIPAASYIVFSMLALTVWIPIFDRILVPWLQSKVTRKEGGITILQRMGIGMVLSVFTMISSALVENRRRTMALNRTALVSPMSGLWLIPQLTLSGLSEAFTLIGENEFFYKECPENMRSIAMALFFCGIAGSSYLSSLLSSIVQKTTGGDGGRQGWLAEDLNRGKLDYFYYLIGGLEFLNLIYFLLCSKWYKYKETEKIPEVSMEKLQISDEKSLV